MFKQQQQQQQLCTTAMSTMLLVVILQADGKYGTIVPFWYIFTATYLEQFENILGLIRFYS